MHAFGELEEAACMCVQPPRVTFHGCVGVVKVVQAVRLGEQRAALADKALELGAGASVHF